MSNDIDYMISVMQAAKRGEEIEFRRLNQASWRALKNDDILWNWCECQYRVKPKEPRVLYSVHSSAGTLLSVSPEKAMAEEVSRRLAGLKVSKFVEVLE